MAEVFMRAGWYPDPDGKPGERWWNGVGWSDSRRGGTTAASPTSVHPGSYASSPTPSASRSSFQVDARQNRVAVAALVLGVLGFVGLSFLGPVAIILGLVGIAKARTLTAHGQPGSSLVLATIGLLTGVVATLFFLGTIVGIVATLGSTV